MEGWGREASRVIQRVPTLLFWVWWGVSLVAQCLLIIAVNVILRLHLERKNWQWAYLIPPPSICLVFYMLSLLLIG